MDNNRLLGTTVCTVRLHREGGWTPLLHLPGQAPPEPPWDAITFPDLLTALQWVRNHYGDVPAAIDDQPASRLA